MGGAVSIYIATRSIESCTRPRVLVEMESQLEQSESQGSSARLRKSSKESKAKVRKAKGRNNVHSRNLVRAIFQIIQAARGILLRTLRIPSHYLLYISIQQCRHFILRLLCGPGRSFPWITCKLTCICSYVQSLQKYQPVMT